MFNRKLIVVPASLAVLAFGATGASADTFLLGNTNSNTNQGINNNQSASQSNLGADGSGTTIVNRSNYSPSVNQGATNANVNAAGAAPTSSRGDTFVTPGLSTTNTNQGINNNQSATQDLAGGGSGTTIVNRSGFTPSINQGVTNANVNATPDAPASPGDLFLLGDSNTNTGQAINSTQSAGQSGADGSGGTLIISRSGFTPSANQGTTNLNCNSDLETCGAVAFFILL